MSVPALAPYLSRLGAYCFRDVERQNQPANNESLIREAIPARHIAPSLEIIEFFVVEAFAACDKHPSGFLRHLNNGGRLYRNSHFCPRSATWRFAGGGYAARMTAQSRHRDCWRDSTQFSTETRDIETRRPWCRVRAGNKAVSPRGARPTNSQTLGGRNPPFSLRARARLVLSSVAPDLCAPCGYGLPGNPQGETGRRSHGASVFSFRRV